ncbi:MAG: DUF4303 domain-containing protein [Woeseiaceae bacterium]|nr:DUF4303 domain-containing protein [Woeseiaceae bacterium]
MKEKDDLTDSIEAYVAESFRGLLDARPESFYYITLATTGEAHPPVLSAWSREALKAAPKADRPLLKWSYADSPYYDFGEAYFGIVEAAYEKRPSLDRLSDDARDAEVCARLEAMEEAMARLDRKGLFGTGPERESLVVAAEVMPPDATNVARVVRLNDGAGLEDWLAEAADAD